MITSETYQAKCKVKVGGRECGRAFNSDVRSKAVKKIADHIRDAHERNGRG